jgi:hypothetical protein
MQKLDRLGWAAGIAFTVCGVSVGLRVNDGSAMERVSTLLPPGWKPLAKSTVGRLYSLILGGPTARAGLRRYNIMYSNSQRLFRIHDADETFRLLELYLHHYIADRASRRTFLHAGVVGWNDRAIVIPGRSRTGKSSLVAALVKAGATYYSDEFAVLDERGQVHPYPIPLAIRREDPALPPAKYRVEELGGAAGVRPLPVGLVLITRYVKDGRFRPRQLSPGRAVLALLANTLPARKRPARVLDTLTAMISGAAVLRGSRGEAEDTVRHVLDGNRWIGASA